MKFFYLFHSENPAKMGRNSVHNFNYDSEKEARDLLRNLSTKKYSDNKYTFLETKRRL